MKRALGLFVSILLLAGSLPAGAVTIGGEEISSLPQDWAQDCWVYPDEAGSSTAVLTRDGDLQLTLETTDADAMGMAKVTTSAYDLSQGPMLLSLDMNLSQSGSQVSDSVIQRFALVSGNTETTVFSLESGKLIPFGDGIPVSCGGGSHSLTLAAEAEGGVMKAALWLDGKLVYNGNPSLGNLNLEALGFLFANESVVAAKAASQWTVGFAAENIEPGSYQFASQPQDGQEMLQPDTLRGIQLDFGTQLGACMYQASNYTLTADGTSVPVRVEGTGAQVTITPQGGFEDLTAYELTIAQIADLYGAALDTPGKTVSFTTSYAGYAVPVVTPAFTQADLNLCQGQRAALEYTVTGEAERLEILLDGQHAAEFTQPPYIYYYDAEEVGSVEIRAAAYDQYGGCGLSAPAQITVTVNAPPEITIAGIQDGADYGSTALPTASISAQDENGVAQLVLEVDGQVVQTVQGDTLEFPLRSLPGGTHTLKVTATDIYGRSASKEVTVSLSVSEGYIIYQNDFSSYTGGNALPQGMAGGPQRGYLDVGQVDNAHGNSLLIGIEVANREIDPNNTAYVGIPANSSRGTVVMDFDFYVSDIPAPSEPENHFRMSLKKTGGQEVSFLVLTSESTAVFSTSGASKTIPYEAGKWYHFQATVNIAKHTMTVKWTDPAGEVTTVEFPALAADLDQLDHLRVFGPQDDAVPCYMAVDNVTVQTLYSLPELAFPETVTAGESVTFTSSQAIDPADLGPANVTLEDENGPVAVAGITSTDGINLTLIPASPLRSNMHYTLTISPSVRFLGGPTVGLAIQGRFYTAPAPMEVLEGSYVQGEAGTEFVFRVQNEGKPIQAVVVTQIWLGDALRRISATPVTIEGDSSDGVTYRTPVPTLAPGERATTYIWNGLVKPKPLSGKVFTE